MKNTKQFKGRNGTNVDRHERAVLAQSGFTYLTVIFLLAVMSLSLVMAGQMWSVSLQREQEKQLLFVGHQFRQAIQQYYERTPGPVKTYPKNLEVLLHDVRYPGTQRYLRKIYRDPITGNSIWGLIPGPDGTIMGVYSLSDKKPLKQTNFKKMDQLFEQKNAYTEWKFVFQIPVHRTLGK